MSKNLTRKGLALGALVALGATLIAGAPAQAANELTLERTAGSLNTTILGETFNLQAVIPPTVIAANYSNLKFKVTNSTSAALTYTADGGTAATGSEVTSVDGTAAAAATATGASSGTSDVVQGKFVDVIGAGAVYEGNAAATQTLGISSAATTAHSVTVQAWLDTTANDTVDGGEWSSAEVTINFVKLADAGITTSLVSPIVGAGTVTGRISSSVVNLSQVNAGHFGVQVGKYINGTKTAVTNLGTGTYNLLTAATIANRSEAVTLVSGNLDTAATTVAFNDGAMQSTLTAGDYVFQAIYSVDPRVGGTAFVVAGSEAALQIAAATAATGAESIDVTANTTAAGSVRETYKGNIDYKVTVKDAAGAVVSGVTVTLTTGALTGTFTVNGVAAAATTAYNAVTNASGVATFTIASSTAVALDSFAVGTITAQSVTLVANGTDLSWAAPTYTIVNLNNPDNSQLVYSANSSASFTFNFEAYDQWKQKLVDANYRLATVIDGTTSYDALGDGAASVTVAGGLVGTSKSFDVVAEKLTTGTWARTDATWTEYEAGELGQLTVNYYTQTDKLTLDAEGAGTADLTAYTATNALVAVDTRKSTTAAATVGTAANTPANYGDETATISGLVENSLTLADKAGALITVTGSSDIVFNVGSVYSAGSISFYDNDGSFAVNAYSNKALVDSVVTVASGAASSTVKLNFNGVVSTAGTVLTPNAVATVVPGKSFTVSVALTDKYGNAVDTSAAIDRDGVAGDVGDTATNFSVTYSGPGIITSTVPTATDSTGTAKLSVLTGAADAGSFVATFKYDGNDDGDYADTVDITKVVTVVVGLPEPSAIVNVIGHRVYVKFVDSRGEEISAVIGGVRITKTAEYNNYVVSRWIKKTGKYSVKAYVAGDLVKAATVTVK